uniref:histidine-rich glycoprotein n=1 Tax=Ictidomys tridecemlineatus TaxID=43179 RepID=UPI0006826E81|nr:histidine-rich glycoprotein [Ictidomys tridecemlineatus]
MKVLTALLLLISLQCSCAVSPTDCNAVEPEAEKAVDLINKWRRNGYLFQLLRVADAHLDTVGSATVYYLVLDVKESDCWVLSRNQEDCIPAHFRRPSDIVIGQCKVIVTRYSKESQDLRMNDFNCTTSSVSSALSNNKDSPVILDFFEDTEQYRKQADKALDKYKSENSDFASFRVDRVERVARGRGGERTKYYLDFSVRNCSTQHFPRPPKVFGFCRADLSYDIGASDLEAPEYLEVTCEVFNFEEHRNISDVRPHWGPPHHFDGHGHSHHHPQKPHKFGFRPPPEGKDNSDRPPLQEGDFPPFLPPPGSRCHHPPFGTNETQRHPHNHSSSDQHHHGPHSHEHGPHGHGPHKHDPHGHGPHGRGPHKHDPHGHGPHGHGPHGHGPHGNGSHGQGPHGHGPQGHGPHGHGPHGHEPHGHGPHGHGPHGHGPHGHGPHGHGPHGHGPHGHGPHGHDFDDYGPCDPPSLGQGPPDHHHRGHGPPHRHPGKRGPGKGHFPFHPRQIGSIVRLPPLNINEVLPLPEANFPNFSLPNCNNPLNTKIQPFPQSASELCPGTFKSEFPHLSKFFAFRSPK